MEDMYPNYLNWPSTSASIFMNESHSGTTLYPMARRRSKTWRAEHVRKLKRKGSKTSSISSTPIAEQDLELEEFLGQMDGSGFYDDRDSVSPRHMSTANIISPLTPPVSRVSLVTEDGALSENGGSAEMLDAKIFGPSTGETHPVEMVFSTQSAYDVCIAGTFSNWKPVKLSRQGNHWRRFLPLGPGIYSYKFVVDGNWICDQTKEIITDEFGNVNNVLRVGTVTARVTWTSTKVRTSAFVAGTFSNWEFVAMRIDSGKAYLDLELPPGKNTMKFFIDGSWELNSNMTSCWDEKGNVNNVIIAGKQNKNFTWDSWNAHSVAIAGTFSDWKPVELMRKGNAWTRDLLLEYGAYDFKFVVDGNWVCDQRWPRRYDNSGNENNFSFHGDC
ncbi:hypothetical protein NDN08_002631 [Rhodosorus marinus]|uniref:AMP-activated protein kinase glycogen-binding domain-containing protein n=1 Tax=Rhodosorus marinus TaxID=101924 RepID=A0AAV8UUC1_9RHOD|nr:hypothetical protein NDN08_002631 [Rhodosorus marinus]